MKSEWYLNRLEFRMQDTKYAPSVVVIQPFSVNDNVFDSALVDASILRSMTLASELRSRGCVVMFRTVVPNKQVIQSAELIRVAGNTALRKSGDLVFDMDAVVSDGATPVAKILPDYTWDAGSHLGPAGNRACGEAFYKVLAQAIS